MLSRSFFPFVFAMAATGALAAPIRIAADGPQAEILDFVRQLGAKSGRLELEVVAVRSAEQARAELLAGRLDASSADDGIAFAERTADSGRLVVATQTVTLPMGLYSRKLRTLGALPRGATVALPRAPHELARALILLQNYGLIELRDGAGTRARLADIVRNRRELHLIALPPSRLSAALPHMALVALDFGAAAKIGLAPARNAIGIEDGRSPYANVLSVRAADSNATWLGDFVALYRSDEVQRFILTRYEDSVRRPW